MPNKPKDLRIIKAIVDLFTILGSFYLTKIFFSATYPVTIKMNEGYYVIAVLVLWFFFSNSNSLYDDFRSKNFSYEFIGILKTIGSMILAGLVLLFVFNIFSVSKYFIGVFFSVLFFILLISRFTVRKVLQYFRLKGHNIRNVLIVGAGEIGMSFFKNILSSPVFGYKLVGFLDDQKNENLNGEYLGSICELEKILNEHSVNDVIVALPNYAFERIEEVIKTCEKHTTRIRIIPDYFRFSSGKFEVGMVGDFPIISVRRERINQIQWRLLKRVFDVAFTVSVFVTLLWWLIPIIAIAIKATSRGPAFFKQERWGRDNRKIFCYKFRSMVVESTDTDQHGKYRQASADDPRITPIGKLLRKTNLDELPQFYNVLLGEMSVVGPRPHPIPLNMESKDKVDGYMLRTLVKPGITGWAQVSGYRGETKKLSQMIKRVEHDLWYIENWSFSLDIQIIFLTVWRMLKGDPNAY